MTSEWQSIQLGDLAEVKHGWPFKSEFFSVVERDRSKPIVVAIGNFEYSGGFRFSTTQVKTYTADFPLEYRLQPGDVLLVMTCQTAGGEILGIPGRIPDDGRIYLHNQRLGRVVPKDERATPDFLYWLFLTKEFNRHLVDSATGTKILHTAPNRIASFNFQLPPLNQQRAISEVLQALDDRITLLRETNTTLEAIAQALFKSWFVDFDPVHAKQKGLPPAGMDEATEALFPDRFEDSALGVVPNGWRVGNLGDIARTVRKQLQTTELHADLRYVGLEHMPRKSLSLTQWGTAEGLESAKSAFGKGDILFGKLRPYFHKVVVAPFDGVCSTDVLVCQGTTPAYFGVATMHLFSTALIEYADRLSNGAKMPRVNWKDLAAYPIVVPPELAAAAYQQAIGTMLARMNANVHEGQTLATLRDTLLPRLISGQLRLPEVNVPAEVTV